MWDMKKAPKSEDLEPLFQRGVRDLNTSQRPAKTTLTTETYTPSPSGEPTAGADFREQAGQQRDKRDSGPLPAQLTPPLTVAALLAAAQRLRDDAADPLLPEIAASVFGGRESLNTAERTNGLVLVRHASRDQLATLWSEAADELEHCAARLCTQAQPTVHPVVAAQPHSSNEAAGVVPGPAPQAGPQPGRDGRAP